jgi:hypothetical protein
VGEALENAAHAAAEGHTAHAQEQDDHGAHGPMHLEHGCGGGTHVCPCHAPTVALAVSVGSEIASASTVTTLELDPLPTPVVLGVRRAPFRPPAS